MPIPQLNTPNNALNSFLAELLGEFRQVKERVKDLEIGTNIYYQLIIVNDDRINYLEERVNQMENQNLNLKKRLIAVEYSSLFLSSVLFFSGIIKLFSDYLLNKKAKVERTKK